MTLKRVFFINKLVLYCYDKLFGFVTTTFAKFLVAIAYQFSISNAASLLLSNNLTLQFCIVWSIILVNIFFAIVFAY